MKIWADAAGELNRPLVSLLVGAVAAGIAVNAGSEILIQRIGRPATVVVALAAAVIVVAAARPVRSLGLTLRGLFQAKVFEVAGPVPGHRGLIVLASRGEGISSAEGAIRPHLDGGRLGHCWILTGGPESAASATGMIEKLKIEGVDPDLFHTLTMSPTDAENPFAVYGKVNEAYRQAESLGLREDEVIGDYTGGTKSMTAGMILACTSPRRHLQFMKPRQYTADGRAVAGAGSDPVAIDMRFELVPLGRDRAPRSEGIETAR